MSQAPGIVAVLALALTIGAGWFVFAVIKRKRHKQLMRAPFPDPWRNILEKNLPPYKGLADDLRRRLHGYIHIFLAEKSFEGCGGLELTDEIRLTIAAQACMLLIGHRSKCYPKLTSVLVYPNTYVAGGKGILGGKHEQKSARLGESWQSGVVVLAWDSVKSGARNFDDGHNVTFHEFAHQLDQEDGAADGAPILDRLSCYASWARVLSGEYERLCQKTRRGKKTVMDRYGATNPAEFFAVATETFFEKPHQLMKKHAELYDELKNYYHIDPVQWK